MYLMISRELHLSKQIQNELENTQQKFIPKVLGNKGKQTEDEDEDEDEDNIIDEFEEE